jgi:type IV secretory pathway component VirB8
MLSRAKKKQPADKDLPGSVEEATAGSSGYPGEVRVTALRERRLLIAIRGISFALIISIVLNTVLAFIIVSLMPLKEIRPFLVQVAEEGTLVAAIQPIQGTFEAKDVLTEKLVREYVVNRHEILRSDSVMQSRWKPSGYLGTTTETIEYNRFRNQVAPVIDEIRARDAQRRATILSVSAVTAGKVYVVDFRSSSFDQNDIIVDQRTYTATLEIDFKPLSGLTRDQMMINPTGFTVVNYSLAEKDQ